MILDTIAVSALFSGDPSIAEALDENDQHHLPVIVIGEVWVAALARQHDLPVLSRDEHFDPVPRLERVSW